MSIVSRCWASASLLSDVSLGKRTRLCLLSPVRRSRSRPTLVLQWLFMPAWSLRDCYQRLHGFAKPRTVSLQTAAFVRRETTADVPLGVCACAEVVDPYVWKCLRCSLCTKRRRPSHPQERAYRLALYLGQSSAARERPSSRAYSIASVRWSIRDSPTRAIPGNLRTGRRTAFSLRTRLTRLLRQRGCIHQRRLVRYIHCCDSLDAAVEVVLGTELDERTQSRYEVANVLQRPFVDGCEGFFFFFFEKESQKLRAAL